MTVAAVTGTHRTVTTEHRIALTDAPPVRYGLAGDLIPTEATVTHTVSGGRESVRVDMPATNRHKVTMYGRWGTPTPTTGDPREYGHDGHGHVRDLPADLLAALHDVTGIALLAPGRKS